jgi:hypothetical protein
MRSSTLLSALVGGLLVVSLCVGPVAAVESTPQDLPADSEVGTELEATFELTELFDEFETWRLRGETDLTNVTWTIQQYDQAGNQVQQNSYDGQSFTESVDIDDGTSRIEVRITGTTPEIDALRYDPPQQLTVADFTLTRDGGTERDIGTHEAHYYTAESREARQAIDSARETVDESSDSDAQETLDSAISAYEAGNFENAITLAERAEEEATQSQQLQSGLLYGGAAIVILLLVGGGYYLYKSRQQGPDRLR